MDPNAMPTMETRFVDLSNSQVGNGNALPATQVITYNVPTKPDSYLDGKNYLKSPDVTPVTFGLHAETVIGSGITQLFFGDATGMAEDLGLVGGPKAQEFSYLGNLTPQDIKEALKTHALIVIGYNFDSNNNTAIKNNLTYLRPKVDEDFDKKSLFSAQTLSNQQYVSDLLNIGQGFVWTNNTALKLNVPSPLVTAVTVDLTFTFLDAIPYGQLAEYLAQAKIPVQNRNLLM